ncbi:MAG TPA: TrbC/VirB2 family protein, partial [Candidatus Saccharimonadaceae bacterium]|nr:TrbC/VirB2 family protein [Candidatus Saccharimonadaceae bacterium]
AGLVAFSAPGAQAINVFSGSCSADSSAKLCKSTSDNASSMIHNIINLLIYAVGIISVIMVVIGGLRYTLSGGDSSGLNSAKNTILYAIVGLVVAVMAYAIVNFVIGKL